MIELLLACFVIGLLVLATLGALSINVLVTVLLVPVVVAFLAIVVILVGRSVSDRTRGTPMPYHAGPANFWYYPHHLATQPVAPVIPQLAVRPVTPTVPEPPGEVEIKLDLTKLDERER